MWHADSFKVREYLAFGARRTISVAAWILLVVLLMMPGSSAVAQSVDLETQQSRCGTIEIIDGQTVYFMCWPSMNIGGQKWTPGAFVEIRVLDLQNDSQYYLSSSTGANAEDPTLWAKVPVGDDGTFNTTIVMNFGEEGSHLGQWIPGNRYRLELVDPVHHAKEYVDIHLLERQDEKTPDEPGEKPVDPDEGKEPTDPSEPGKEPTDPSEPDEKPVDPDEDKNPTDPREPGKEPIDPDEKPTLPDSNNGSNDNENPKDPVEPSRPQEPIDKDKTPQTDQRPSISAPIPGGQPSSIVLSAPRGIQDDAPITTGRNFESPSPAAENSSTAPLSNSTPQIHQRVQNIPRVVEQDAVAGIFDAHGQAQTTHESESQQYVVTYMVLALGALLLGPGIAVSAHSFLRYRSRK